jgi:hypothetical protein
MFMSPAGFGHENDSAGEDQQQLQITDPSSVQMLHKGYDRKCSVERKITVHESQGSCRQDKLMGGNPSVET